MPRRSGKRRGDARLRVVRDRDLGPGKRGAAEPGTTLQPLVLELRRTLRSREPWELLALVATTVSIAEAGEDRAGDRSQEAGAGDGHLPSPGDAAGPTLALRSLVESFIGVDLAETTAALTVLAQFLQEPALRADIATELAHRRQPMPPWLTDLGEASVTGAAIMGDLLGSQDDIILGVTWAGGGEGSFVVLVDHSRGAVVKDAFPTPASFDETLDHLETMAQHDPTMEVELDELDLGEARGLLEEALEPGPPPVDVEPESGTWPSSRPILRWLLSRMPEPQAPGWADEDLLEPFGLLDELLERNNNDMVEFAASEDAKAIGFSLTDELDNQAASLVLSFGGMPSATGLRWTPEQVEHLLLRAIPSHALIDPVIAQRLPAVLKAFVLWGLDGGVDGDRDGPRAGGATATAVGAAVDRNGPRFLELVTSTQAVALREALRDYQQLLEVEELAMPIVEPGGLQDDLDQWLLHWRAQEVGGMAALMALDAEPLPDEPFAWSAVPEELHGQVSEVVGLLDDFADRSFGTEFRTACRRFLATVVTGDPRVVRRGSARSTAAVIAWLIGRASGLVAHGKDSMTAQDLWAHFGRGNASQRAGTFLKAAGVSTDAEHDDLGHAEWLTSRRRAELVSIRDELTARNE